MAPKLSSLPLATAEAKTFGNISLQSVQLGSMTARRMTVPPGSSWSKDIKAHAGTESCQTTHVGYVLSGRLAAKMDDGQEINVGEGEVFVVPAGHDAWCASEDEPVVFLEWTNGSDGVGRE